MLLSVSRLVGKCLRVGARQYAFCFDIDERQENVCVVKGGESGIAKYGSGGGGKGWFLCFKSVHILFVLSEVPLHCFAATMVLRDCMKLIYLLTKNN